MTTYRLRLHKEHDELFLKLENLKKFIISDGFESLPDAEKKDLVEQEQHMHNYFIVLNRRVRRLFEKVDL